MSFGGFKISQISKKYLEKNIPGGKVLNTVLKVKKILDSLMVSDKQKKRYIISQRVKIIVEFLINYLEDIVIFIYHGINLGYEEFDEFKEKNIIDLKEKELLSKIKKDISTAYKFFEELILLDEEEIIPYLLWIPTDNLKNIIICIDFFIKREEKRYENLKITINQVIEMRESKPPQNIF